MGFGVIDGGGGAAPTIVASLYGPAVPMVACASGIGEPRWALVDTSELDGRGDSSISFGSVLSLRGRFCVVTSGGDVLGVEFHPVPRLVYVARQRQTTTAALPDNAPPSSFDFFLAPSSGDHHRAGAAPHGARQKRPSGCRGARASRWTWTWFLRAPSASLGTGRAVLIGSTRALSVSAGLFPSVAADAVYFCTGSRSMSLLLFRVLRNPYEQVGGEHAVRCGRVAHGGEFSGPLGCTRACTIGPDQAGLFTFWPS
jgi:hypothetical protein